MRMALNPNTQLSSEERSAMLAVWAGHAPHNTITAALYFLDMHCPRKYLLPILQWLLSNKLTGKKFHDFIAGDCGGRYLEVQRRLLEKVERAPGLVLVAGKTFK